MLTTATKPTIAFSPDQQDAVDRIEQWLDTPSFNRGDLTFGGYAGSGKTTVINHLWPRFQSEGMLFMAPTGKAADVMRRKGMKACTVHQAIYLFKGVKETYDGNEKPIFEDRPDWKGPIPKILGCDESSMINAPVYRDIKSKGLSCLFVGDHFQLPCIGEDPGLMNNPMIRLEKVHRQAEGSSILRMAHSIRNGNGFRREDVDNSTTFLVKLPTESMKVGYAIEHGITQTIVALNATRHAFNKIYRHKAGLKGGLAVGDRIIVLSNDWDLMIFNGQTFTVDSINSEEETYFSINMSDWEGKIRKNIQVQKISLGNPDYKTSMKLEGKIAADFAYAITCNKAQGDGFPKVMYIDQAFNHVDRHRYTGVTRAVNEIHAVV